MKCWVLGCEIEMANGVRRISEPFMVYTDERRAYEAKTLVETISGQRAMLIEGGLDTSAAALSEEDRNG